MSDSNSSDSRLSAAEIMANFDQLIADFKTSVTDIKREDQETVAWSTRLDAQRASDELDRKLDDLEFLMRRGKYVYLRTAEEQLADDIDAGRQQPLPFMLRVQA